MTACNHTRGAFHRDGDEFQCAECGSTYHVRDDRIGRALVRWALFGLALVIFAMMCLALTTEGPA